MFPGKYAQQHADRPAFIMATSGESMSYSELERRSNQLAHLLRAQGQDDAKRRAQRCITAVQEASRLASGRGWLS